MKHKLAHLFGLNTGYAYSWWDSDTGKLMMGFRCDGCGTISGVHETEHTRRAELKARFYGNAQHNVQQYR